jgi:hypothetical protein
VGSERVARDDPIDGTRWLGNTHRAPTTCRRETVPADDPRRNPLRGNRAARVPFHIYESGTVPLCAASAAITQGVGPRCHSRAGGGPWCSHEGPCSVDATRGVHVGRACGAGPATCCGVWVAAAVDGTTLSGKRARPNRSAVTRLPVTPQLATVLLTDARRPSPHPKGWSEARRAIGMLENDSVLGHKVSVLTLPLLCGTGASGRYALMMFADTC